MTEHNSKEMRRQYDEAVSKEAAARNRVIAAKTALDNSIIRETEAELEKAGTPVGSKVWTFWAGKKTAVFVHSVEVSGWHRPEIKLARMKKDGTARAIPTYIGSERIEPFTESTNT